MIEFFAPVTHPSSLFAMGSLGHLALNLVLFVLLGVLIFFRKELPGLLKSRPFMVGSAGFVLGIEALSYLLKLIYPVDPAFELLPLQLCSSLKIAITLLVLFNRYDWVKQLSVLAVGCGFISFVNLNLHGESFGNFTFWHYAIGHCYLFLAPLFFFLAGEHRFDLRGHLRMCLGLAIWSFSIFLVNWAFDTNYMYTGPHNDTVVPFVPASMMAWPFNYVSYVLIAAVLLNVTYALLRFCQARMGAGTTPSTEAPAAAQALAA